MDIKTFRFVHSLILPFILLSLVPFSIQGDAPVIDVLTGKIKGEEKESRDDKTFFAYRGIPYATAKRFEPPGKPQNWTGVRDAEDYGKECIQYSTYEKKVIGSEDCLFLNVFSPKTGEGTSKKLMPVMVFIHGTFMDGSADIYRAHYFMDEELVIVTFNYRLNVFGFLSTGDDIVRGNMGLRDQIMALQWVQDNIRKFAGDPKRVTIFGAGDGASSVHLLMLSPLAKGLYRKAITQSGTALKPNVIQKRPKEAAERIARLFNCEKILNETGNVTKISDGSHFYDNSTFIVECLRKVDAKKLAEFQKDAFKLFRDPLSFFGPVVESPSKDSREPGFLTEHPYSIMLSGRQNRVSWMTGFNAQEGLISTGDKSIMDRIDANWLQISPHLLNYDWTRMDITNKIRRFYLSENNYNLFTDSGTTTLSNPTTSSSLQSPTLYPILNSQAQPRPQLPAILPVMSTLAPEEELPTINFEEQFKNFTDLFTDRFYLVAIFEAVKIQSLYSPVFVYNYNYEGQYSLFDVYTGKTKEPTPATKKVSNWFKKNILGRAPQAPKHMGVCNGDELLLLFKYPDLKIKENTKDYQMSKDLVKVWVQFATDETNMEFKNSKWIPITSGTPNYNVMKFGNNEQDSGLGPISEDLLNRMEFWETLKYLAPFDQ